MACEKQMVFAPSWRRTSHASEGDKVGVTGDGKVWVGEEIRVMPSAGEGDGFGMIGNGNGKVKTG